MQLWAIKDAATKMSFSDPVLSLSLSLSLSLHPPSVKLSAARGL